MSCNHQSDIKLTTRTFVFWRDLGLMQLGVATFITNSGAFMLNAFSQNIDGARKTNKLLLFASGLGILSGATQGWRMHNIANHRPGDFGLQSLRDFGSQSLGVFTCVFNIGAFAINSLMNHVNITKKMRQTLVIASGLGFLSGVIQWIRMTDELRHNDDKNYKMVFINRETGEYTDE